MAHTDYRTLEATSPVLVMANFASRILVESIVTIFTRQSAVEFGFFDLCQRKHVFLYDYLFAYRFFSS